MSVCHHIEREPGMSLCGREINKDGMDKEDAKRSSYITTHYYCATCEELRKSLKKMGATND
jgi:hypothetical protein